MSIDINSLLYGDQDVESLGMVISKEFTDKLFRIRGFGPAKMDRFSMAISSKVGYYDYDFVFNSLINNDSYGVRVCTLVEYDQADMLISAIYGSKDLELIKEVSEWDIALYKKTPLTVLELIGQSFRENLNSYYGQTLAQWDLNPPKPTKMALESILDPKPPEGTPRPKK